MFDHHYRVKNSRLGFELGTPECPNPSSGTIRYCDNQVDCENQLSDIPKVHMLPSFASLNSIVPCGLNRTSRPTRKNLSGEYLTVLPDALNNVTGCPHPSLHRSPSACRAHPFPRASLPTLSATLINRSTSGPCPQLVPVRPW